MSRYLITGGAGFIGSHLADRLISMGDEVIILDNLSSGKASNINKHCQFIKEDVTDINTVNHAFKNVNFCYHLAAVPSVQSSITRWIECHRVNLGGSINVFATAAAKNIPVVYASSAAVYKNNNDALTIAEAHEVKPISPYGFDKYCSEQQAKLFAEIKGLKSLGLRMFNVYGTRQSPSSAYSGVISIFIKNILNDNPLEIFGNGEQERDFIHIDDVVTALVQSMLYTFSKKNKVINICTGIGTSVNTLVNYLRETVGKKVEAKYCPPRGQDIYKSIGNPDMALRVINFKAKTKIKEWIKSTVGYIE